MVPSSMGNSLASDNDSSSTSTSESSNPLRPRTSKKSTRMSAELHHRPSAMHQQYEPLETVDETASESDVSTPTTVTPLANGALPTIAVSPPPSKASIKKSSSARLLHAAAHSLDATKKYEVKGAKMPGDLIFDLMRYPDRDEASITKLIKVLRSVGLWECDPRLKPMMDKIAEVEDAAEQFDLADGRFVSNRDGIHMDRATFKQCIKPCMDLITRGLRNQLVIPEWPEFVDKIEDIYEMCQDIADGHVATYIPQLARADPKLWGLSICSVSGQRASLGDAKHEFCIQSVSKAFNYAIVASDIGTEQIHNYMGHEPSGRLFNEICLDPTGKPHNPMINSGAIITTSLMGLGKPMAERFDETLKKYKRIAGNQHVGFNNATFLSERDTADRNYALSYYMKEYGCFPRGIASLREELDFYFQMCSIEMNCETLAVMAATLANGGVNPLTLDKCVEPKPCRDVLSLMYSCGMYDLSGKFAFQVGLPAKSGVSGGMIVVIPNVMGICLFSPPLDKTGNSTRGVAFCKALVDTFNFHNYDSLVHTDNHKIDPRRRTSDRDTETVVSLLYAAKHGDMEDINRLYMQGANFDVADYDGRTALHVAASEGLSRIVRFLIRTVNVDTKLRDRWGRTALDDAILFKHSKCARLLKAHEEHGFHAPLPEASDSDTEDEEESFRKSRPGRSAKTSISSTEGMRMNSLILGSPGREKSRERKESGREGPRFSIQ